GVPPFVVVCAGVELAGPELVGGWDWVLAAAVPVVWGGAPATETVLVEEPQPPISAPASVPRTSTVAPGTPPLIASMVFVLDARVPGPGASLRRSRAAAGKADHGAGERRCAVRPWRQASMHLLATANLLPWTATDGAPRERAIGPAR